MKSADVENLNEVIQVSNAGFESGFICKHLNGDRNE